MSVARIGYWWRLPGCGDDCFAGRHDPENHERYGYLQALARPPSARVIRTGPLVVDLDARTVTVEGRPVHTTGREWGILAYLAERIGQACTHDEIIAAAWGPEWVTGRRATHASKTGTYSTDHHMLKVNLSRLGSKLGSARGLIVSVAHYGHTGRRLENLPPVEVAS